MNRNNQLNSCSISQFFTVFLFLLSLCLSTQAIAQSSVWKVEKNGRHIYLGGTLHLLTKSDYPLPGEYDLAYNNAQIVYFETDIEKLSAPKASGSIPKSSQRKTGKTLDQQLNPDTLKALKAHLKARQLPFERFKYHSPNGIYLTLMAMELARNGLASLGVDAHFAKRARLDKKAIGKFETINQHLLFLTKMAGNSADKLILNGLKDMKNVPVMVDELKKIWRSGDRKKYRTQMLLPYKQYYPRPYKVLLVDRNNQWMPKIEAMFKTPEVELILVGALHMIGPHGILQRLEAKGYNVEAL